ncbi:Oxidoreductase, NAD-binding domain protein [uncultured Desulfobacterium sp.]|uniref:Oxidoreductase, NAD-binding domain protein n=1 Tax=uncultured Desulfobacterium sp. TaxID=201089 RepID=A0A445N086_9BACT|nr:Oxidoreductase, NAD-binding domain protein [uncultured Desulfobacterium sp.]
MIHDKLRVAVIGVGHLGEYHVQKYKAISNVELIGIADTNPVRAKEISDLYGVKAFNSHKELLGKVDAVSLVVPTEQHFEVAKDVLSRGVHLLIEKPITYQLQPADIMINMAREKGLVFQVGLVERFNPAVVMMESLLSKPVFLESHRMNEFTARGIDVDVVIDLMIHDLDIILHNVRSEIKEVHAVGMSVITDKTDIANSRIVFEDGTVANLTASRVSNKNLRKIRVFQPDAYMSINCLKREISVIRLDADLKNKNQFPQLSAEKTTFPGRDPLADEIASFVNSVIAGTEPVVSGDDGRKALKVALGIINQIESGCRSFRAI